MLWGSRRGGVDFSNYLHQWSWVVPTGVGLNSVLVRQFQRLLFLCESTGQGGPSPTTEALLAAPSGRCRTRRSCCYHRVPVKINWKSSKHDSQPISNSWPSLADQHQLSQPPHWGRILALRAQRKGVRARSRHRKVDTRCGLVCPLPVQSGRRWVAMTCLDVLDQICCAVRRFWPCECVTCNVANMHCRQNKNNIIVWYIHSMFF